MNGTIAKSKIAASGMERVEFTIIGAIDEARSVGGQSHVSRAGCVVLQTARVGQIDAEATIDVSPTPTVGGDIRTKSNVARTRID